MGRRPTRKSSLKLMIARAEFIKSHLVASKRNEFEEDDIIVRDTKRLIEQLENFDYMSDGGQMNISPLPEKMFQKFVFRKEQLLYRLDEIIALCTTELQHCETEVEPVVLDDANNGELGIKIE